MKILENLVRSNKNPRSKSSENGENGIAVPQWRRRERSCDRPLQLRPKRMPSKRPRFVIIN